MYRDRGLFVAQLKLQYFFLELLVVPEPYKFLGLKLWVYILNVFQFYLLIWTKNIDDFCPKINAHRLGACLVSISPSTKL